MENKEQLLRITEDFEMSIGKIKDALRSDDKEALVEIFTKVKKDKEFVENENFKSKS